MYCHNADCLWPLQVQVVCFKGAMKDRFSGKIMDKVVSLTHNGTVASNLSLTANYAMTADSKVAGGQQGFGPPYQIEGSSINGS